MEVKVNYYDINLVDWKDFLSKINAEKIVMKSYEYRNLPAQNFTISDLTITNTEIQIDQEDFSNFQYRILDENRAFSSIGFIKTFMWLDVTLAPPVGGTYSALNSELTSTGLNQCQILKQQLMKISEIYLIQENYYALFTSLIQSSGFGKTKICVELLSETPGLYLVFRKQLESGIPYQTKWMSDLSLFITQAPHDDLPININDIKTRKAMDFTPGRFLIILCELLKCYFNTYMSLRTTTEILREQAFKILGGHMLLQPSESEFQFEVVIPANDERNIGTVIGDIKRFVNLFSTVNINRENVENQYFKEIMKLTPESKYPFILFLDEMENINQFIISGRITAIHIIRRALHLLDSDTRLLVVAIGTNCDALDFTPAIRDNSLRILARKNLLPPFILSGNWDIFDHSHPTRNFEVTRELLLNRAMFNLLVSMGRPLWSSCPLNEVIKIAQAKLRNGAEKCTGALLAQLMVRSSLTVNVHHILSRTLIRSYMIIVNYISTDARDMKIGYSSEPVLAMAARNLLKEKPTRDLAFRALLEFLQKQAIDKGRIVETMFQYLTLFAVDDALMRSQVLHGSTDEEIPEDARVIINPEFTDDYNSVPVDIRPLAACRSHLLELLDRNRERRNREQNESERASLDYTFIKSQNYRVISIAAYLEGIFDRGDCSAMRPYLSNVDLKGLVNCTHFINLERLKPGDFFGLEGTWNQGDAKYNIIDKSLLKCGLLRQCGFVMPEGYPGVDYIVPYLSFDEHGRPVYSFLAFQSKSSKQSIHDCAFKMAAKLHLVKSPVVVNNARNINNNAKFTDQEMDHICSNQLVFLLCLKNGQKRNVDTDTARLTALQAKVSLYVNEQNVSSRSRPRTRDRIIHDVKRKYSQYMPNIRNNDINLLKYPSFSSKSVAPKPNLILTKSIDPNLSVQKMVWVDERRRKRCLTCIACFDVEKFAKKLVTPNTVNVIKKIANYTASVFDNVDPLHLGIVQNSSLYGKFSSYHLYNPILSRMRYRNIIPINPIEAYLSNLTHSSLNNSIEKCIIGPTDLQVSIQSLNESENDNENDDDIEMDIDLETEMEIFD